MLISLILSIFKVSLGNQYSNKFSHLIEALSVYIGLVIYYYVSKTFGESVNVEGTYFEYVVFGEILLSIPLYFLDAPFRKLRSSIIEGTFLTYLSLPISVNRMILILSSWNLVQLIKRTAITLIFAVIFFEFHISVLVLIKLLIFTLLCSPIFLGLGLIISSLLMYFGRGSSVLGHLNTLIAISAGSFFPLSVLPSWIESFLIKFSPFTIFLVNSRKILHDTLSSSEFIYSCVVLVIWSFVFLIGRLLFKKSIEYYRKSGSIKVLSHY